MGVKNKLHHGGQGEHRERVRAILEGVPVFDAEEVAIPDIGGDAVSITGVDGVTFPEVEARANFDVEDVDAGRGLHHVIATSLQAPEDMPRDELENRRDLILVAIDEPIAGTDTIH